MGCTDDHVVVHGNPQQPPGFGDALGDLDVGAARLRASARVVVDQNQRGGAEVEAASDHFARVDRGFVDGALARHVVADQSVSAVEVEHADALDRQVRHVDGEVVEQRLP